jgi:hypothetical protein
MNTPGKLETAANAATIVAALLISIVLIKVYLLPAAPTRTRLATPAIAVGTSMKDRLAGVDWQKNSRTLVLALSTKCHFCTESAPFFRKLVEEPGRNAKLLAILPQPVAESKRYLGEENVHVDAVMQASLSKVGIRGTPTMLLVNGGGVVTNVWIGRLEPSQQAQVLEVLRNAGAELVLPVLPRGTAVNRAVSGTANAHSAARQGG